MASVTLKEVSKSFGAFDVLRSIDLDIEDGEFVVFVGPSGCGKSTLLRVVAGLVPVSQGTVSIDGEEVTDVPASKRGVAFVFQSYALYPHMNVARNISFALETARMTKLEIGRRLAKVADMLKIGHLLDRKPKQLSGGQRQRVAIGRALVSQPKLFLFDEPLSNLDADLRMEMRFEIAKLHAEVSATMIYVTHDQTEAMTLADRIVILNHGRIEQVGTPRQLYDHPANKFVAGFLGSPRMNFASVSESQGWITGPGGFELELDQRHEKKPVTLGLRPESLEIISADSGRCIKGIFERVEDLGYEQIAYIRLSDETIWTVRSGGAIPACASGSKVGLRWKPEDIYLFDDKDQCLDVGPVLKPAVGISQ
ncbi:multiple sugar transport system ATP-binding protein [Phyllobacterium ifriqiyense]|uniref:Multiple sugar transport system ATP-binding protein n=1 Tax=Phyllobacterium ifriqiyense TaxID=314238 RepID=A0ABU0S6Z0_9HYPH|nr:ABC transporter ATP-binding protein [Phyllobacterium ifriqiyense]MDQ0995453.1 multiple sugar transport system ATP-binding protein [Phyllobacterium ifriqiyense]